MQRRRFLHHLAGLPATLPLLPVVPVLLAGCGGGADNPPAAGSPTIRAFTADTATLYVGEQARLTPVFEGGSGRIEPGIGPVASGTPVRTPTLARATRYTLVVEAPGRPPVRRELQLDVRHRDRYVRLPVDRTLQYHAAVAASDGSVLVFGGARGETVVSDAIDRFDPVQRTFTRIGTLRTGRWAHTATRIDAGPAAGHVLVLGGGVGVDIGPVADLVDARTGAVSGAGRLQQPRMRHATVALADGRVLVVGGSNRDTLELWDPATRLFRLVAARLRHVREHPSATLLDDGRVLIAGGDTIATDYQLAEVFDPVTESLRPVASPTTARRHFHAAHRLPDGRVVLIGGEASDEQRTRLDQTAEVLVFDPATNTLARRPDLDLPRSLAAAVGVGDEVLLFGGATPDAPVAASGVRWRDGAPVAPLAALPEGRLFHTATRLGDGRILILGGDTAEGTPVTSVLIYE